MKVFRIGSIVVGCIILSPFVLLFLPLLLLGTCVSEALDFLYRE